MHYTLNVPSNIQNFELRQNPVIITVNEFTEESALNFRSQMCEAMNSGQKIIPVVIDSYGGQVYSLMSMIASINASPIPVATIVQGKAMSCGAILSTFGADGLRFIDKDATLMIHDVSSFAFGKIEELKADAREAERLNKKVYQMMARNCGKPEDYFTKIIHDKGHADWFLDADEAIEHGICQHKRIPELKVNVTIDIDIE